MSLSYWRSPKRPALYQTELSVPICPWKQNKTKFFLFFWCESFHFIKLFFGWQVERILRTEARPASSIVLFSHRAFLSKSCKVALLVGGAKNGCLITQWPLAMAAPLASSSSAKEKTMVSSSGLSPEKAPQVFESFTLELTAYQCSNDASCPYKVLPNKTSVQGIFK